MASLDPDSEPRPEVIEEEEEEEEMQSPSTPNTPSVRSLGARSGGALGSAATSTSTSESGAAPTRQDLHRKLKLQAKHQQQVKERLVHMTEPLRDSFTEAKTRFDVTKTELWEVV